MAEFRIDAENIRNVIYRANERLLDKYPNCPTEYRIKLWEEKYNVKFVPHNHDECLYDGVDVDIVFPSKNDYLTFVLKYA